MSQANINVSKVQQAGNGPDIARATFGAGDRKSPVLGHLTSVR